MKSLKNDSIVKPELFALHELHKRKEIPSCSNEKTKHVRSSFFSIWNDQLLRLNLFRRETDGGQKSRQLQPE